MANAESELPPVQIDPKQLSAELGEGLVAGLFQLLISANRTLSFYHLVMLNREQVENDSPTAFDRNQWTLFAWAASQVHEMAHAINDLEAIGVETKLKKATGDWTKLKEIRDRWTASDFIRIRNNLGYHQSAKVIKKGLKRLGGAPLLIVASSSPKRGHLYFPGADEALIEGLWGQKSEEEMQEMLGQVEQDQAAIPTLVERVFLDLTDAL